MPPIRLKLTISLLLLGLPLTAWLLPSRASSQTRPIEERVTIGALDPYAPQGIAFITGTSQSPGISFFGLRLLVYRPQGKVEERPRRLVYGPQAPDGSYASLSWYSSYDEQTPITLRWSRLQPHLIVGQVTAPPGVRIALEIYRPLLIESGAGKDPSWNSFLARSDRTTLLGEAIHTRSGMIPRRRFMLRTDRTAIGAASYRDSESFRAMLSREGHAQNVESESSQREPSLMQPYRQAALSFDMSQQNRLSFVATVGDQWETMEQEAGTVLRRPVTDWLDQAEKRFGENRPASDGALGDIFETIRHRLEWNRYFDSERQTLYLAPYRNVVEQGATSTRGPEISGESMLMAMMGTLSDPAAASATLRQVLEGQLTDGRIPPRRHLNPAQSTDRADQWVSASRSLPPIGSYIALKIYLTTGDLEFLAWAYPRLLLWNDWWFYNRGDGHAWRDGNNDGLLEWGFNDVLEFGSLARQQFTPAIKQRMALAESAFETREAGLMPSDALFNDRSETLEMNSVALNSLYALDTESLAGIARELGLSIESNRLQSRYQELRTLINNKLWDEESGLYLDRDWESHASRRMTLENFYPLVAGLPDQTRAKRVIDRLREERISGLPPLFTPPPAGVTVPVADPISDLGRYLTYQGLRRYGRHEDAALLARQSLARARLSSDQLRSSLLSWPSIEELLCPDPGSGLNIGSIATKEEARLERIPLGESRLDVIVGPVRTVIRRNGRIELECEAAVRLRNYLKQERSLSFTVETPVQVRMFVPGEDGRKITVSVDDKILGSTSIGATASFRVPVGTHRVVVVK